MYKYSVTEFEKKLRMEGEREKLRIWVVRRVSIYALQTNSLKYVWVSIT